MTYRHDLLIRYTANAEDALNLLKTKGNRFLDSDMIWQILVYELEFYDVPTEILHRRLTVDDIVRIVNRFYEKYGLPIGSIDISDSFYIEEDGQNILEKANVKIGGTKWILHINDLDPFPSNPHAHDYEKYLKLHLGNGLLYRNKIEKGKIHKKDLVKIREEFKMKLPGIKLPKMSV